MSTTSRFSLFGATCMAMLFLGLVAGGARTAIAAAPAQNDPTPTIDHAAHHGGAPAATPQPLSPTALPAAPATGDDPEAHDPDASTAVTATTMTGGMMQGGMMGGDMKAHMEVMNADLQSLMADMQAMSDTMMAGTMAAPMTPEMATRMGHMLGMMEGMSGMMQGMHGMMSGGMMSGGMQGGVMGDPQNRTDPAEDTANPGTQAPGDTMSGMQGGMMQGEMMGAMHSQMTGMMGRMQSMMGSMVAELMQSGSLDELPADLQIRMMGMRERMSAMMAQMEDMHGAGMMQGGMMQGESTADASSAVHQLDEGDVPADLHAGHAMTDTAASIVDPHAGHVMTDTATADPHAGHAMTDTAASIVDPHAGHVMTDTATADPHAGHDMSGAAPVAGASVLHAGHGGHGPVSSEGLPSASVTSGAQPLAPTMVEGVKVFTLTAEAVLWPIMDGVTVTAWTYNGMVPGPLLRATEGENVRIVITNNLPDATAIHWHGLLVPNAQDGAAPMTQDAIQPGETFTYEFVAKPAGSFMYHSHVGTDKQVLLGLYAPFIVDPVEPEADAPDVDVVMM
ncbi:MAG: multicopper oxidase domain-containing protein, partial [Caldilineaceae bacterium]